jgi:hypothetical protein
MLANLSVITVGPNEVRVDFPDPRQAQKAALNQAIEPMLGLSPHDREELRPEVQATLRENVKNMGKGR